MGAIAARDARAIVELAEHVTAIALLAVCQALDLRGVRHASSGAQSVHALVRERVRTLDGDRRMQDDIAHAVDLVRSGILSDVVRAEALV
jgi:histidine ammonia-lyase/phenylalanine ammonia-lyase